MPSPTVLIIIVLAVGVCYLVVKYLLEKRRKESLQSDAQAQGLDYAEDDYSALRHLIGPPFETADSQEIAERLSDGEVTCAHQISNIIKHTTDSDGNRRTETKKKHHLVAVIEGEVPVAYSEITPKRWTHGVVGMLTGKTYKAGDELLDKVIARVTHGGSSQDLQTLELEAPLDDHVAATIDPTVIPAILATSSGQRLAELLAQGPPTLSIRLSDTVVLAWQDDRAPDEVSDFDAVRTAALLARDAVRESSATGSATA